MGVLSCLAIILAVSALVWLFWLLYSKILSAIVKRPFGDILANEVYSSFPLVVLLLVSLLFKHRNVVLAMSLASVVAMKITLIARPEENKSFRLDSLVTTVITNHIDYICGNLSFCVKFLVLLRIKFTQYIV